MTTLQRQPIGPDASVRHLLIPLNTLMQTPGVTEIVLNEPGRIVFEKHGQWTEVDIPMLNFEHCMSLARSIANLTAQRVNEEDTVLSATLPTGERIHMVVPPTVPDRTVSLTMRIPSPQNKTLEQYEAEGFFDRIPNGRQLFEGFVLDAKNIAIVGVTGSGKTTFMKTLCQLIDPGERIITIEDARELFLPNHTNKVHLVYTTYGKARIDSAGLIRSTLRMKPDRVLPAELRGAEALDFAELLTTGHNGSITSFHADSCQLAFDRFALMCKAHPKAANYTHEDLIGLFRRTIDVIAHVACETSEHGQRRFLSEILINNR